MLSANDFFAYTGATPAPKKISITPSKKNLSAIRQKVVISYNKPISHTVTEIDPFPNAVNIFSNEFMNGGMKISAKFSQDTNPRTTTAAVIMPKDNQPPRTVLIDSDAMRIESPLQLVIYSDASFAIFGTTDKTATKKYKDDLQSLGGKFNNWLKRNGEPTP